jgi:hypothetical protein
MSAVGDHNLTMYQYHQYLLSKAQAAQPQARMAPIGGTQPLSIASALYPRLPRDGDTNGANGGTSKGRM